MFLAQGLFDFALQEVFRGMRHLLAHAVGGITNIQQKDYVGSQPSSRDEGTVYREIQPTLVDKLF